MTAVSADELAARDLAHMLTSARRAAPVHSCASDGELPTRDRAERIRLEHALIRAGGHP